ncbi:hypothetical protein EVAR_72706_1, partial [Eumeta japonica]
MGAYDYRSGYETADFTPTIILDRRLRWKYHRRKSQKSSHDLCGGHRWNTNVQKVQRTSCLGVSEVSRASSTEAIETILSIEPIEIPIRYEAALAAKRLNVMDEWIDQEHEMYYQ